MNIKQLHCTPICATPSNAAAQLPPSNSLQHFTSSLLAGKVRMFPMAAMELSPPSSTHQGDRPSDERREMILRCCGRYEIRIPRTSTLARVTAKGFGEASASQWVVSETVMMSSTVRRPVYGISRWGRTKGGTEAEGGGWFVDCHMLVAEEQLRLLRWDVVCRVMHLLPAASNRSNRVSVVDASMLLTNNSQVLTRADTES